MQAKSQCHFVQVNLVIESIFKDPKVAYFPWGGGVIWPLNEHENLNFGNE